jgi:hypothetical protein
MTPHEWLPMSFAGGNGKGYGVFSIDGDLLQTVATAKEAAAIVRRAKQNAATQPRSLAAARPQQLSDKLACLSEAAQLHVQAVARSSPESVDFAIAALIRQGHVARR